MDSTSSLCRRRRPAWIGLSLLLLLGAGLPQDDAAADQGCLKMVFNRYCLGGDIERLAQQLPGVRYEDGERTALLYFEGGEQDYVLAWRGRIYKVLRQYRISSQLRYEELYGLLRDKYGSGKDQSRFPAYANRPGSRQIAIRRGEGRAAHVWRTDGGWHIELSWTRELGLSLAYLADELEREQEAARQGGL